MKFKNTILPVLAIGLLIFSSCEKSTICIKGNNRSTTKTIEMSTFDGVQLDGSFNVAVHQGTESQIIVTGDENIVDRFQAEIINGTCLLNLKRGCYKNYNLKVDVTTPNIEKVILAGSGNIELHQFTNQNQLVVALDGSGNITINKFEGATNYSFSIAGSGNIACNEEITNANNLKIEIDGSGNYNGYKLAAKNAYARIGGSGDVRLTATENLEAIIDGSGTIRYRGNPSVSQKITGSGSVIKVD